MAVLGRTGSHACVQGSGGCPCGLLVVAAGGCCEASCPAFIAPPAARFDDDEKQA
jgi:hypothetical protein